MNHFRMWASDDGRPHFFIPRLRYDHTGGGQGPSHPHAHSAEIRALEPVRRDKKVMGDRHRPGTAGAIRTLYDIRHRFTSLPTRRRLPGHMHLFCKPSLGPSMLSAQFRKKFFGIHGENPAVLKIIKKKFILNVPLFDIVVPTF